MKSAENAVERGLDITDLLPSEVTVAVNKKREVLGLELLSAINLETDLSAGTKTEDSQSTFNRASAIRDIEAVTSYVTEHKDLDTAVSDLVTALTELAADPAVLDALKHRQLVEAGLPLVVSTACPLCDLEWPDVTSLRQHLNAKLTRSAAAAKLQQRIQTAAGKVAGQLRGVRSLIQGAQPHAVTMGQSALQASLLDWSNDLAAFEAKLATIDSIRDESERLTNDPLDTPSPITDGLKALRATIEAPSVHQ